MPIAGWAKTTYDLPMLVKRFQFVGVVVESKARVVDNPGRIGEGRQAANRRIAAPTPLRLSEWWSKGPRATAREEADRHSGWNYCRGT